MTDASTTPLPRARLEGRVAIVTGASRGIGEAVARLFAREGAAVAVVARTEQVFDERLPGTIHDTVAAIEADGGRAVAIRADLGDEDDVDRVVDEARGAFGPIDLLVNNAALTVPGRPPTKGDAPDAPRKREGRPPTRTTTTRPGSFLGFPLKGYRLHFQIGLFASYRLMQLVVPDMIELGRGGIVNISSLAAFVPGPGPYEHAGGPTVLAYGGNKAAMHHLTQAVAFEVAPHNVAVNALLPSEPVLTPGNRIAYSGDDFASVDDFAEATLQVALADPAVMTGQILWSEDVLHPELGTRGWLRS
jgi:NAD(P)-dependent dehydrogenase (short-subunit alcohol dehydrogenase family)